MEDYRLEQTGQEVQGILNGAAMQTELAAETERATAAEQQLQGNIDAEELARQQAGAALQEYADGKVSDEADARQQADELLLGNIDAEEFRAKAAEAANATAIETINGKIPAEASAENKLVDNAALQGTYYTKDAVDNLIQGLGQNDVIVGTLPASGVANTIYRVPGDGVYSDYMWYNGAWQLLATYSANIQGYQYIGIATPTTNPGTPSNNVFYFAHEAGTYTNFGALVVTQGINILKFDGTSWTLEQLVGIDDVPTAGSENLVQSGGLVEMYGGYIDNSEYVYVKTDNEDKILWAIKKDGSVFYGAGVPQQVKDYIQQKIDDLSLDEYEDIVAFLSDYLGSDTTLKVMIDGIDTSITALDEAKLDKEGLDEEALGTVKVAQTTDYIQATTDSEDKILEGITKDGVKHVNIPVESPSNIEEYIYNQEWLEVKTDKNKKIIEGVKYDGKKHISDFDDDTKAVIKEIAQEGVGIDSIIEIPVLDANFVSPIPVTITGTKGDENAQYVFNLPLEETWGIRFKFHITENLLNQNKSAVIASIGSASLSAVPTQLTASSSLPTFNGGISLNGSPLDVHKVYNRNIGNFAFSIQYTGSESTATIQNDGTAITVVIGSDTNTFALSQYETMLSLYTALSNIPDITVKCVELEARTTDELAKFGVISLIRGSGDDIDKAPVYIPYAIDTKWHLAEIVKIGDKVYSMVDGYQQVYNTFNSHILTLGGNCGVLFKDFSVDMTEAFDCELVSVDDAPFIISSWNPHIVIHEGHEVLTSPSPEEVVSEEMATTVDRLQLVYSRLKEKGYVAVSIKDIADFYGGNKMLPKRCFTTIFDDRRWSNFLNLSKRAVFTRFNVKPCCAIVSDGNSNITENDVQLTTKEACEIGRRVGFELISHTHDHRVITSQKPSEYESYFADDMYSADLNGILPDILVYPTGAHNGYMKDVMCWMGYKLGILVQSNNYDGERNTLIKSRYALYREEIGLRYSISNILKKII